MDQTLTFACHEGRMGNWTYYVAQLSMKSLESLISFHKDIFDSSNRRLSGWMQRETEARKSLLKYLSTREDRFFPSIVVGFKSGTPKFIPLQATNMKDDEHLKYFDMEYTGVQVGLLKFPPDPSRQMYAIDGQHRLTAIKTLLDPNQKEYIKPDGFEKEVVSVIFVAVDDPEDSEQRYRRLFSSLNRYAKPTGDMMNIIMDDNDIFAILTRRLYEEHPFFEAGENESTGFVAIQKGKAMSKDKLAFTNLISFYEFIREIIHNKLLLELDKDKNIKNQISNYILARPDEDKLDWFYDDLANMWEALMISFPEFTNCSPVDGRDANKEKTANLLFTPIGWGVLGQLIQIITSDKVDFSKTTSQDDYIELFKPLTMIPWKMRQAKWLSGLVCLEKKNPKTNQKEWTMNFESRVEAVKLVKEISLWLIGDVDWRDSEIEEYKIMWRQTGNEKSEKEANECFEELIDLRARINQA